MKGISMTGMLLIAGLTASLFAAAPVNLFTNGSFETSANGAAYGWGFEVNDTNAKATRIIDSVTGTAKAGKGFCRITVTKVTDQNWHVQMKDPAWTPKIGYIYHFSIWARSDAERKAALSIYGGPDGQYTYRTGSEMNLTTEWQQFHQVFTADADQPGRINFAVVCGGAIGVYDFDDAVLTEAPPTTDIYKNGSFELDKAGWNLWVKTDTPATGKATFTVESTGAKSGTKFGRIAVTAAAANAYEVQLQDASWACSLYFNYTFKFWAKADTERTITVAAQPGETRSYTDLAAQSVTLTKEWTEQTFTYTSLDLQGSDSLSFVIYFGAQVGVYDIDSVTLFGKIDSTLIPPCVGDTCPCIGDTCTGIQQIRSAVKAGMKPLTISILRERLQCTIASAATAPFRVDIMSIQGRVFSTHTITTTGRVFDLPRPPSGTWIVRVNSDRGSLVTVP